MPASKENLDQVVKAIRDALKPRGLQIKTCGTAAQSAVPKPIDAKTGLWQDSGQNGKTQRWLVYLVPSGKSLTVEFNDKARLGYVNPRHDCGAVGFRVLPVARVGKTFHVIEAWEWMLVFVFPKALAPGSSSENIDFDPSTGKLTYLDVQQRYVSAALIKLAADDVAVKLGSASFTYEQATAALGKSLKIETDGK